MRVLLQGRRQPSEQHSGDSTLVSALERELSALGQDIEVHAQPPEGGLERFDVVQLFNLGRSMLTQTEALAAAASSAGAKIVMTPIWWPLQEFARRLPAVERMAFWAKGNSVLRGLHDRRARSLRTVRRRQAQLLSAVDVVCPSGPAEGDALEAQFGRLPLRPIMLGTDAVPAEEASRSGILCVARIDPHKNQLALIRALNGTRIPLDFVGTEAMFPAYASRCHNIAGPNVRFRGYLPHGSDELKHAYAGARVHALGSFFELPGLTCLDAAASGCAVVGPEAGTLKDHLGTDAWYCRPDEGSIREAVLAAHEVGPPEKLAETMRERFTWRATAKEYLKVYCGD